MNEEIRRVYEFGAFRLDVEERVLLRGGEKIALTQKALELLLLLVERCGHVVSKEDLINALWPDTFVDENNLPVTISMLRKAFGETASAGQFIETVPRRGYRFISDVRLLKDESAELIIERRTRSRIVIEEEASPQAGTGVMPSTMAVLPFTTSGAEAGDSYLGLGITDALVTRLSNIRQIVVRPTSAVLKYASGMRDLPAIGRELGVDLLLDGRVRQAGARIRITMQLVSVEDGRPLWGEKFDERFTDIFTLEDSVSRHVARSLLPTLTGEEHQLLTRRYTDDAEAYRAYLKGRYFWNKRSKEGMLKGIEYFKQAIEIDPQYALAYAGMADCYTSLCNHGLLSPDETLPQAKAAAMKALAIDDTLAEAHTSLGWLRKNYDWDWLGAEQEYLRALELNPNYATARQLYGMFLVAMGRFGEGEANLQQALELDPLSLSINTSIGQSLYFARRYDESIEQLQKTIEMDASFTPARFNLALDYIAKRDYAEAIGELQSLTAHTNGNSSVVATLGSTYALAGRIIEARKILGDLKTLSQRDFVLPYDIALIHACLGETDEALAYLEQAYRDRYASLIFLKVDPDFDILRSDPRFKNMLMRLGFDES